MINVKDYNLIYIRKEDGRLFLVKSLSTKLEYSVIDTTNARVEKMSQSKLRRLMKPHPANKYNKKPMPFMNFARRKIA